MSSLRSLTQIRGFSTSPPRSASILFALQSLSNSRETQHFNKLSRLQRVEHSPSLKLIETSEVKPYSAPQPVEPSAVAASQETADPSRIWDAKALEVGRSILADNARHVAELTEALERAKRKEQQDTVSMQKEMEQWAKERRRMKHEMRSAGAWILLSVGAATGLAMWRFWPEKGARDAHVIAREITERASKAAAAPVVASQDVATKEVPSLIMPTPTPAMATIAPEVPKESVQTSGSWWKSLFWKQQ